MLNKYKWKEWTYFLVPGLKGNSFKFFTVEYDVGFGTYGLYYVEVYFLYFVENLYHKLMLNFVKYFFTASVEIIIKFVFFLLLMWHVTLINF